MKNISILFIIIFFHINSFAQLSITASSNSPICSGDTLILTSTVTCKGIKALDGSNKYYRYATVYDWDCCLLSSPGIFESPFGWAVDGHYKIQYDCNGNGKVVESTGNYVSIHPVGVSYTPTFPYSSNPTYASLVTDGGCCNADGSKIYVQLTEEINNATVLNYNWAGPNSFSSNEQNPEILNTPTTASGSYTVTVTDYSSNTASSSVSVTVNASPANLGDKILTEGLVAYYPFNGNANDESGNGNNGTVYGATLVNDSCGNLNSAYNFDGINDSILVGEPVPASLQIQNEITLSAWIYVTQYPASNTLGLIAGSQCDNCGYRGVTIFLDGRTDSDGQTCPAGHIHFQIGDGSWHVTNANSQVPLNRWVQIVATRKANENGKIYYNGVLQPSTSVAWTGSISYDNTMFAMGKQKDYSNRFFNGKMDEVRVYNRALNETEIQALYHMNCNSSLNVDVVDSICKNGTAQINLNNSQIGINYQLYENGDVYGSPQVGNGDTVVFEINDADISSDYTITATNTVTGCVTPLDTIISFTNQQAIANAGADVYTCSGGRIYLTASGGCNNTSYLWSYNNLNTETIMVYPTSTITYTVTATNCYGCTATDEVTIYIKSACEVNAGKDTTICLGQSITLCASGCTEYIWFNGSHDQCITLIPTISSSYNVSGEDANHCPVSDNVTVNILTAPNNPVISLSAGGDSLISDTLYGNQWYCNGVIIPNDTDYVCTPSVSGDYFSIVTNSCGSDTSNAIHITIVGLSDIKGIQGMRIYPNPADDNITIEFTDASEKNNVSIYNVEGQKIIEQNTSASTGKTLVGISDLQKGIYFLKVMNENNITVIRFIKE
ncbi:MAG TPA: T9SS type A sorting domain-containing protein [Bacteroidales bacterium]|nr:T9SS type A sorting domain-containing protein [Bacteroidales bacterium]HPS15697.1 T9SS type A sorting domain-containing protein [Bacteroidales bacterium]